MGTRGLNMLTEKEEKWVDSLGASKIVVVPFDASCEEKFMRLQSIIQTGLGEEVPVEHHGASSLGISGQDEIDAYIPVPPNLYDYYVNRVTELFGAPRSHYPLERTRFRADVDGKRIDLFVINEESEGWINSLKFEHYLKTHPETLEQYRVLKETNSGLPSSEYYRRKIEFIHEILDAI